MSGKRKLKQVSGEADTGNKSKKRPERDECEINKEDSSVQQDSSVTVPLLAIPSNPTSTQALAKFEDMSTSDDEESQSLEEKDRRHLLHILPEDVWRLIFEELGNPADLENVSNSSLYFRQLLSPQRTQFLFHKVCKHLEVAYLQSSDDFDDGQDTDSESSEDEEYDENEARVQSWFEEMVNLRLVCRSWSTAVDNFFQNHPLHFRESNMPDGDETDERNLVQNLLRTKNTLSNDPLSGHSNLLSHFASTHENADRNPFVGRLIEIVICTPRNVDEFSNQIVSVLERYGHHVWYCFFSILTWIRCTEMERYFEIRKSLELMPNLKVLHFDKEVHMFRRPCLQEEVQAEINSRPLPNMQNLQMLKVSNLYPSIFRELVRKISNVSTLVVNRRAYCTYSYEISDVVLPELKKLDISFYSEAEFLGMDTDLVDWPLTELDLSFVSIFIEWQKVFNVLEKKFKNTLTKMLLRLPGVIRKANEDRIYRDAHTYTLNLPRLTSLFVKLSDLACLDFVLPMRESITDLRVEVWLMCHENIIRPLEKVEAGSNRILKLLSCVRRPSESNVWALFPKLKYVWYKVESCKYQIECSSVCQDHWEVNKSCK